MTTAFVLGSCVTRDCFEVAGEKSLRCSDYFARTSLVSLVAEPRPLSEDVEFTTPNNFARKAIRRDFDKSFFDTISTAEFDIFVIDFIDERFAILEHDGSYVTQSHEMERSGLLTVPGLSFSRLNRFSPKVDELWKAACRAFAPKLRAALRGRPLVIHRSIWAEHYQNKAGEIVPFDAKWMEKIVANNRLLNSYYDFLKSQLPEAIEVAIAPNDTIADEGHKWGLHAIHYLPGYYEKLYRRLEEIAAVPARSEPAAVQPAPKRWSLLGKFRLALR